MPRRDFGIVMLTNYHGLPREMFDSFGWHKLFTYDFVTTPVAYAPVQILFGKRYVEYDKLTINNSYDNGLRIYKKTNSRFNNEVPFEDSITGCLAKPRHSDANLPVLRYEWFNDRDPVPRCVRLHRLPTEGQSKNQKSQHDENARYDFFQPTPPEKELDDGIRAFFHTGNEKERKPGRRGAIF